MINGAITGMVDYQYDDNGTLNRKVFYDGEGKIEKYEDYIYNKKGKIVKVEVYKTTDDLVTGSFFIYDASDLNSKVYDYNAEGMCIFERTGLDSEKSFQYYYDERGRISRIECTCNGEFEYVQNIKYRFDGKIKEETINKGEYVHIFKEWYWFKKPFNKRYIYDNKGNLIRTEQNDNTITRYYYNENNNLVREEIMVKGKITNYKEYTYSFYEKQ